jgi:hypothetical protein
MGHWVDGMFSVFEWTNTGNEYDIIKGRIAAIGSLTSVVALAAISKMNINNLVIISWY